MFVLIWKMPPNASMRLCNFLYMYFNIVHVVSFPEIKDNQLHDSLIFGSIRFVEKTVSLFLT